MNYRNYETVIDPTSKTAIFLAERDGMVGYEFGLGEAWLKSDHSNLSFSEHVDDVLRRFGCDPSEVGRKQTLVAYLLLRERLRGSETPRKYGIGMPVALL